MRYDEMVLNVAPTNFENHEKPIEKQWKQMPKKNNQKENNP